MDAYSVPVGRQDIATESGIVLGSLITLTRRANPAKPGRTLSVGWDSRQPLIDGFTNEYSYTMRFDVPPGGQGVPAGNHYHKHKTELFRSLIGRFLVTLEDRETWEQAHLELDSRSTDDNGHPIEQFVHVPVGVPHAVLPLSEGESALDVIANHPNVEGDEFPYEL
jgi:hypothetical protein